MNWKKIFWLGLASSVLSSIASLLYAWIYREAFYVDFSQVIGPVNIITASTIGCYLMVIVQLQVVEWRGEKAQVWLNIIWSITSFSSIAGVFGFDLPLDIESPELFPGMVVPMHFFPVLSMLTISPFFSHSSVSPSNSTLKP